MADFRPEDYGAIADGTALDTQPIQQAIDAAHAAGGGRIRFSSGKRYLSGSLFMKSRTELHLERGAVIRASPNPSDYRGELKHTALRSPDGSNPNYLGPAMAFLMCEEGCEDIGFTGDGAIDGAGQDYVEEDRGAIFKMKDPRPYTFYLRGAKRVTFRDLTIRDGAVWTLRITGCQDVLIQSVRILNDLKVPNSDGIDIERCQRVRVVGCEIVSGDDCIALKACEESEPYGPTEDVVVTGCTLVSTSSAISVGCECKVPMRRLVFTSCTVAATHRGLNVHLSEESDIEDVLFSDFVVETRMFDDRWWGRGEPIYVVALPWFEHHGVGRVRNVRFRNILCKGETGVVVVGTDSQNIEGLSFESVRVEIAKRSKFAGGRLDLRPNPWSDFVEAPAAGFLLRNAKRVEVRNCEVVFADPPVDARGEAVDWDGVEDLRVENLRGGTVVRGRPLELG